MITDLLPLNQWQWIVVNSSGGKDSQTALRQIVMMCDLDGIPRSRIVVSHQCLGPMEWPGTIDLARRQAKHYGLRFEVSEYRDKTGAKLTLLDYVEKRGMWPDNKNRFCTSEFKRGPGGRVIVRLFREQRGPVLNVYGFRAEESPARRKKTPFIYNKRFSSEQREVFDYLPIHTWKEAEVWRAIELSGVPHHQAYDLGMPRLSCCFCIFAPRDALIRAGIANPELLDRYVQLEKRIGHTFQNGKPIADIQTAIAAGEQPKAVGGAWNM